jgi:MFS family permease
MAVHRTGDGGSAALGSRIHDSTRCPPNLPHRRPVRVTGAARPAPIVTGGKPALAGLLFAAMGAGTFTLVATGILATFIIDDLGISRGQLGLVIGADSLLAAALSPLVGRFADRLGGKRAMMSVFVLAATAYIAYGLAPVYSLLFVGALFGGAADASCNPATNRLIAESLAPGARGVITGIKQSGVQAGAFFGGLILPSLAVAYGWRSSYLIVASVPLVAAVATGVAVRTTPRPLGHRHDGAGVRLPTSVRWLAGYGFLFGFAGAVSFLVPLYVDEGLGYDARIGGLAAAAIGIVAVGGRIGWAHLAEGHNVFVGPLWMMTPIAVLGGFAFLGAAAFPPLVWLGAMLIGLSTSSWNSVGMLAVMTEAGMAATGKASGLVVFGFLTGLGLGPPIYGAMVDATGSYAPMWWTSIAASAATFVLVAVWRRAQPYLP